MTRAELRQRMSAREFGEWMAYYSISPFGERRDDFRAGLISSILAEIHRNDQKRHQPFTPNDFLLKFEIDESPSVAAAASLAEAERINAQFLAFVEGNKAVAGAWRAKPKKPS